MTVTCYALGVTTINTDPVSRRKVYDPRVRELVCATGNPDLFPELNVPKSTLRGLGSMASLRRQIGAQSVSRTEIELYAKLAKLRRRVQSLQAVMCLLLALVRVTGCLCWLFRRSASSRRHLVSDDEVLRELESN